MNNITFADRKLEILLVGKWRLDTDWEKIFLEFKDDMTYEQTRIQTFFLSKPKEYITGNQFTGVWHVNNNQLCLIVKTVPKSLLNLQLSILLKVSVADMIASFVSLLITENYEILEINASEFIIKDDKQSIIGTRIN